MRIGIDARFLTHPQSGGFKTYTWNLISSLAEIEPAAEIGPDDEYILYLDRDPGSQHRLPAAPNFSYRVVPGEMPMLGMIWREQVGLALQAARDRVDLLHSPCLTAPLSLHCPSVVTIHDTIWHFPHRYSQRATQRVPVRRQLIDWYYRYIPLWAARRAAVILTISQAAKESIIRHLRIPAGRIRVTYEAASSIFHQITGADYLEAVRQKFALPRQYILAMGSADPRKNISTLIQAFGYIPGPLRDAYNLVIVWNHASLLSEVTGQVEALGLAGQVRFVQQVTNEDLVGLYNAAALFVFPSLYEGFGLPLLEAMSCGVPVISADNSSLPEVAGDAALLVKAEDALTMGRLMADVLQNPALRRELREKGLQRAKYFSWKTCACETVAAYRQVAAAGPGGILSLRNNCMESVNAER